ncbi:hypothetical protein L6452_33960 [Arctium lappa]|uniref:Uncharacterized protein n=1 Tax=Arctium lappa TaxID=4217 RepID=A0ACB8YI29_ARCLA|nr:hypothetical protein L6452_33960 [Arctium lappa]
MKITLFQDPDVEPQPPNSICVVEQPPRLIRISDDSLFGQSTPHFTALTRFSFTILHRPQILVEFQKSMFISVKGLSSRVISEARSQVLLKNYVKPLRVFGTLGPLQMMTNDQPFSQKLNTILSSLDVITKTVREIARRQTPPSKSVPQATAAPSIQPPLVIIPATTTPDVQDIILMES